MRDPAPYIHGFSSHERRQRVRPTELRGILLNPHKGIATYQRFNGEAPDPVDGGWNDAGPLPRPPYLGTLKNPGYPDTRVAYLRWEWKKFEPARGQRNWALLDEFLRTAQEREQTIQFRFNTYDVGYEDWWYWGTGAGKAENGEPDINDPRWFECYGDLIREFGMRYDGHPALDTVDASIGGMWGESGGNASRETTELFLDLYLDAFRSTPILVLEDGDHALTYASDKRLGWRADCFGDLRRGGAPGRIPDDRVWNHQMDRYPFMLQRNRCQENWRHSPVTFETCWNVGKWYEQGFDVDFLLAQLPHYHTTYFMPKSNAIPEEWQDRFAAVNNRLGYHYVPRQIVLPLRVHAAENIHIEAWVDNLGCAPIYRRYDMALRVSQDGRSEIVRLKTDITGWMPGITTFREVVRFPAWLVDGPAMIDIGLVDSSGIPRVRFATQGVDPDGWHPVAGMIVETKR
jgi:hypothetical protein